MSAGELEEGAATGAVADVDADSVEAYLRATPDFLARRPDLLAELQVPHGVTGAASLIEMQVVALRRRNEEARARLEHLVANARDNEGLSRRLHDLAVGLLGVHAATDMFAEVYASLADGFRADCAAIRIYATPQHADAGGCGEFVGESGPCTEAMEQCMHHKKPHCGALDEATSRLLFAERAEAVRSAALVPLVAPGLKGLLVIGSFDETRYAASAGTHFLEQLGELVAHAAARYLNHGRS